MNERKNVFKHIDFNLLDILCLVISFCLGNYFRHGHINITNNIVYSNTLLIMVLLEIAITFFYEPFKNVLKRGYIKEVRITITFVVLNLLGTTFYLYVTKSGSYNSRLVLAYTYIMYLFLSFVTRILLKKYIHSRYTGSMKSSGKALLVVGNKNTIKHYLEKLTHYNFDAYSISGLCIVDEDMIGKQMKGFPVVASKATILDWSLREWVDGVFFGMDINEIPRELIDSLSTAGITMHYAFSESYNIEGQVQSIDKIGSYTVLTSTNREYTNRQLLFKRLMDIIGGIVGSLITLLIALIIGPIIYIKSPGPILYTSERIGMNGRRFRMYKFRSMIPNAEALKEDLQTENMIKDGMMFKMKDDPRIIPGIGNFIRKTSLDEFPQFFNVLKGDMSLVGTRPPTPDEWEKYKPEHRMRMSIKPGVTGLWQISGRSSITDFDEVVKLDKEYIDNWDLGYDIKILVKTVLYLFNRKDDAM